MKYLCLNDREWDAVIYALTHTNSESIKFTNPSQIHQVEVVGYCLHFGTSYGLTRVNKCFFQDTLRSYMESINVIAA